MLWGGNRDLYGTDRRITHEPEILLALFGRSYDRESGSVEAAIPRRLRALGAVRLASLAALASRERTAAGALRRHCMSRPRCCGWRRLDRELTGSGSRFALIDIAPVARGNTEHERDRRREAP
jgi:hypothetical protein